MRAIIIAFVAGGATSAAAQLPLPPLPNIFGAPRVTARLYVGASATDRGSVFRSVSNAVDDGRGVRTFGVDLILNTGFDPRAPWAPEIAIGFSRLDGLRRGTLGGESAVGTLAGHSRALPSASVFLRFVGAVDEHDGQYAADVHAADTASSGRIADSIRRRAAADYRRRTNSERPIPYVGLSLTPYELHSASLQAADGVLEGEGRKASGLAALVGIENVGLRGVFIEAAYSTIRFRGLHWYAPDSDTESASGPRTLDLSGIGVRMGVRLSMPGA